MWIKWAGHWGDGAWLAGQHGREQVTDRTLIHCPAGMVAFIRQNTGESFVVHEHQRAGSRRH
ncbi:MAG: hypothetical protein PVJ66_10020, partial [Gammaproteobacteria bacterium]